MATDKASGRVRRPQGEWRRLIRELRRSGLTVKEFSSQRGLLASTLMWWRWRLDRAKAPSAIKPEGRRRHARPPRPELRLLPVHVEASDASPAASPSALRWEVETPSGHVLRVYADPGTAALSALIERLLDTSREDRS
jgi:hypothetical protein